MRQFQGKQLTLVSHYGAKPEPFARLIRDLQRAVEHRLEALFEPYTLHQVHGTLIGLEGSRVGPRVRNENFWRLRGEERAMDFGALLAFLRPGSWPEIQIAIGGFSADAPCSFASQGLHPYERSFSIQKRRVVSMGWPAGAMSPPGSLDGLRRRFQDFGVLHKWHARPDAIDDDFFFVLGTLRDELPDDRKATVESDLRQQMALSPPCLLSLGRESLGFVEYEDPQLPPHRTRVHDVLAADISSALLEAVYSDPP